MEAGAAERAARGQRRERVRDWPLMGASEYKHVVLGSIFLKYVEDAIDERRASRAMPAWSTAAKPGPPSPTRSAARSSWTSSRSPRSWLHEVFNDRTESLTDCKPTSPTSECA
jgi:hypothetical protein